MYEDTKLIKQISVVASANYYKEIGEGVALSGLKIPKGMHYFTRIPIINIRPIVL